jgi:hypothetical protein
MTAMRERIPIETLILEGSTNLQRSRKREEAERNAPPLSAEQKTEIEKLDDLIAMSMKACKRGHTFRGKPNPAFEHVAKLIKARDILLKGKAKPAKIADAQGEVEDFLKKAGIN